MVKEPYRLPDRPTSKSRPDSDQLRRRLAQHLEAEKQAKKGGK